MNLTENIVVTANNNTIYKRETLRKHHVLIDSVRRCHSNDKTLIAKAANVSWPTVNNFLSMYSDSDKADDKLILVVDEKYVVNPEYGLFLGIAVGARETKTTIIDMSLNKPSDECAKKYHLEALFDDFKKINQLNIKKSSEKYMVCFETKDELEYISHMCNEIIKTTLNFFKKEKSCCLLGIGITFPGIIDKKDLKVSFCPNINCLNGAYLLNVLYESVLNDLNQSSVSLCIAHDTLAITVFEKENLYHIENNFKYRDKENIVCLYMGMGLGLGVIVNNQLISGNNNSVGEIGHIHSPSIDELKPKKYRNSQALNSDVEENEDENYEKDYTTSLNSSEKIVLSQVEKCHCRLSDCIEKHIRINVFNATTIDQFITNSHVDLLEHFDKEHPYRYAVLKHYLKYLFNIIINLFNPDLLVLSGRILNSIDALGKEMYSLKQSSAIHHPATNCDIINGSKNPDCVAIGAAILAYYKLVEGNGKNDESGMQFNVGWTKLS